MNEHNKNNGRRPHGGGSVRLPDCRGFTRVSRKEVDREQGRELQLIKERPDTRTSKPPVGTGPVRRQESFRVWASGGG